MGISDREFDAIQDAASVETVEIDGVTYATKQLHDVRAPEPAASALTVAGLDGIVEYLAAHNEQLEADGAMLHVAAFDRVDLVSAPFGRFRQRHTFATAKAAWPEGLRFGQYTDAETFNVQLQALFVPTDALARVLAVVGNIREVNEQATEDDGTTQKVTVQTGITRLANASAPNPVTLAPYRTFREVEQPESRFVLRLRAGTPPQCALFEADGGAWKLEAVARIKAWLVGNLPEDFHVIG